MWKEFGETALNVSIMSISLTISAPTISSFVQFLPEKCYIPAHVQMLRYLLTYFDRIRRPNRGEIYSSSSLSSSASLSSS